MNGARNVLRARLGRLVRGSSACALGDGAPPGEEGLGIRRRLSAMAGQVGDWRLGEKAEASRTSTIHDRPSTIRMDRRFGRNVAELGMAGASLLVFSVQCSVFSFQGREKRELAECRLAIPVTARLCSAALVQSRKCGEEAECRKGEFLEKANIGRTLSDLSACPGIIQRATPGEPQVLHRRRMLPGDCPEFAVHRVSLKSNLKIELRTLYRTAPRERRIG